LVKQVTPAAIREARHTLGLTQAELARALGYGSVSRVAELERGARVPGGCVVRLLQAYLDGYRPADWPGTEQGQNVATAPDPGGNVRQKR
jgi:transcriptional regulator with XRE-family HTH domain